VPGFVRLHPVHEITDLGQPPAVVESASKAFFDRWLMIPLEVGFRNTRQEIPRNVLDRRYRRGELSGVLKEALPALRRIRREARFVGLLEPALNAFKSSGSGITTAKMPSRFRTG
jgi:hypothetical protein